MLFVDVLSDVTELYSLACETESTAFRQVGRMIVRATK